jgi:hypothetical protein
MENNKQQWISVGVQLPDFNKAVLVCDINNQERDADIARLESFTENSSGRSENWLEGKSRYDGYVWNITHWMPLPKTIKKEENE